MGRASEKKAQSEPAGHGPRKKSFGGRPGRAAEPGERIHLGLRVTHDLKQRLERVAETKGRSQSQEAEFRLERSFDRDELLPEALKLAFGSRAGGLLLMIGYAMTTAGLAQLTRQGKELFDKKNHWIEDPTAFSAAAAAAKMLLQFAEPKGRPIDAGMIDGMDVAQLMQNAFSNQSDHPFFEVSETLRNLLGPDLVERIKNWPAHSQVPNESTMSSSIARPRKAQGGRG